jgi:hypothetical protein
MGLGLSVCHAYPRLEVDIFVLFQYVKELFSPFVAEGAGIEPAVHRTPLVNLPNMSIIVTLFGF